MSREFDFVVIGQGLAGTALTWWLHWAGARVLVIDREESVTSSRIAAGLITPVTGQKLVSSWRYPELWPAALSFYQRVERETESHFFHCRTMLRLFASEAESALFARRASEPDFPVEFRQPIQGWNANWFRGGPDGFEMSGGGQLDVVAYLDASRRFFRRVGCYQACDVDVSRETELRADAVFLRSPDVKTKELLFCQGIDAATNPWFHQVQFKPAKGEILTLRIPGLAEERVIHRGIWLARVGEETYKAGATYNWKSLDNRPTASGCHEIAAQLAEFLALPFEVINHQAAVRPIHRNQYPVLGRHPLHPQLSYFNGLGSKGALHAPFFAKQLVDMLVDEGSIDPSVDLNLKTVWSPPPTLSRFERRPQSVRPPKPPRSIPLTQQAQQAVSEVIRPGDFAIDATAGNGHDTQFLAELVGSEGRVIAFDIQQVAIANTACRLEKAGLQNVTLWNRDHAEINDMIPPEWTGRIAAIMFNLGYLPGGDKQIITRADSSRHSVALSARLLKPGGIMTVLAYTGHDGGKSEADQVEQVVTGLPANSFEVRIIQSQPGRAAGPRLFVVRRQLRAAEVDSSVAG